MGRRHLREHGRTCRVLAGAAGVRAECTVRTGGVSVGPYSSLNLGTHVGDELGAVTENRRRVRDALKLPENRTGSRRCTARS